MHPNASEHVRKPPKTSENVQNRRMNIDFHRKLPKSFRTSTNSFRAKHIYEFTTRYYTKPNKRSSIEVKSKSVPKTAKKIAKKKTPVFINISLNKNLVNNMCFKNMNIRSSPVLSMY